jgi:phage terminase large subunit-like protein
MSQSVININSKSSNFFIVEVIADDLECDETLNSSSEAEQNTQNIIDMADDGDNVFKENSKDIKEGIYS